jgi:hypothetical protein
MKKTTKRPALNKGGAITSSKEQVGENDKLEKAAVLQGRMNPVEDTLGKRK